MDKNKPKNMVERALGSTIEAKRVFKA